MKIISKNRVGLLDFIKVNCAEHSAFCRAKNVKLFPTIEIYVPPPLANASFSEKMRFRLLKGAGNYSICPFQSDFSYQGFKAALEELFLIPKRDPYYDIKVQLQMQLEESYHNTKT